MTHLRKHWIVYATVLAVAACCAIVGCGGWGGQGIVIRAENGSTVQDVHINIADGGTDMGGLFYRPKVDGNASVNQPTTRPAE